MFVSLHKGDSRGDTALAQIGFSIRVKQRDDYYMHNNGFVELTNQEFVTLCRRAIKKGYLNKEDL